MTTASRIGWTAALMGAAAFCTAHAASPHANPIPDFAVGSPTGWAMDLSKGDDYLPPVSGTGPVTFDPQHPYVANMVATLAMPPTLRIADVSNPLLRPWAAAQMQKANEGVLAGGFAFTAKSTCRPGSVPGIHLFQYEPLYFVQTPAEVWLIWEFDNQVRRVYLNRAHSAHPTPSWYGESVGHYEGDTLVVDTVGILAAPDNFVDNYRTPHTDQLHVVERFRTINDGKVLEVGFTVEDPGTFTAAWSGRQHYNRVQHRGMVETICAENTAAYFKSETPPPVPQATSPDF